MNIQVTKEQIDYIIAMANCIKLSNYTAAVTTITTIHKGMKVKFSGNVSENFCYCFIFSAVISITA